MKWLSVKKFYPLLGVEYLVTDGERCYLAELNHCNNWIDINHEKVINIICFCQLDPIAVIEE